MPVLLLVPLGALSLWITYAAICLVIVDEEENVGLHFLNKYRKPLGPGWHIEWRYPWPFREARKIPSTLLKTEFEVAVMPAEAAGAIFFHPKSGKPRRYRQLKDWERSEIESNPLQQRHRMKVKITLWWKIPKEGIGNLVRNLGGSVSKASEALAEAGQAVTREVLALFTIDTTLLSGREVMEMVLARLGGSQVGLPGSRLDREPPSWGIQLEKIQITDLVPDGAVSSSQIGFAAAISDRKRDIEQAISDMRRLELMARVMAAPEGERAAILEAAGKIFGPQDKTIIAQGLAGPIASLTEVFNVLKKDGRA